MFPCPGDPRGCRRVAVATALPDTRAIWRRSSYRRGGSNSAGDSGVACGCVDEEADMDRCSAVRGGGDSADELAGIDGARDGGARVRPFSDGRISYRELAGDDRDGGCRVSDRISMAA